MVKIRYSELPVGLHVTTESDGRHTVIYLLPGLTPAERRAALIRVRSSARMGQGPDLPATGMATAVVADRMRMTARTVGAAMRAHPMLLLPPLIALVAGVVALTLMSFVKLTADQSAGSAGPPPVARVTTRPGNPKPSVLRRMPSPAQPSHRLVGGESQSGPSPASARPAAVSRSSSPGPLGWVASSRRPSGSLLPRGGKCKKPRKLGACVRG
jgi:hypothetical protein